jgi:hypothetical protein
MSQLKQIGIDVEVNAAIERERRSFSETENFILRRLLLTGSAPPAAALPSLAGPPSGTARGMPAAGRAELLPGERITGRWTVEVLGERVAAANLKGAYRTLLLLLADRVPDFFQKFAQERSRSRRFVARAPADLYLASPELAKQHAKPLAQGWYFDTNLSTDQVTRRVRIAARICGLRYGSNVRLLNNLEEI